MDRVAFGLGQLDRLANFFPRVEGKATALFAIDGAMLGIIALNYPFRATDSIPAGFGGAAAILVCLSIWQLYGVFFPATKPGNTHSMLYFGDIASGSSCEYESLLSSMDSERILKDIACQIHRNSEILADKYSKIQIASIFSAFGFLIWVIFLISLALSGANLKWGN